MHVLSRTCTHAPRHMATCAWCVSTCCVRDCWSRWRGTFHCTTFLPTLCSSSATTLRPCLLVPIPGPIGYSTGPGIPLAVKPDRLTRTSEPGEPRKMPRRQEASACGEPPSPFRSTNTSNAEEETKTSPSTSAATSTAPTSAYHRRRDEKTAANSSHVDSVRGVLRTPR